MSDFERLIQLIKNFLVIIVCLAILYAMVGSIAAVHGYLNDLERIRTWPLN